MGDFKITTKFGHVVFAVEIIVFVVGAFAMLTMPLAWVAMLLSYAGFTHWPPTPSKETLVIFLVASMSGVCACLWIGSQVEIFRLKEGAQKLIGGAFIATALAAVVLAFKGVFSK